MEYVGEEPSSLEILSGVADALPQVHEHLDQGPRQNVLVQAPRPVYAEVFSQAFSIAMPQPAEFLEPWYLALRSSGGCCFRVIQGDRDHYRQKLYEARRLAGDPQLSTLSITLSPTADDELWIVHREAPNAETEDSSGQEESHDELSLPELREDG